MAYPAAKNCVNHGKVAERHHGLGPDRCPGSGSVPDQKSGNGIRGNPPDSATGRSCRNDPDSVSTGGHVKKTLMDICYGGRHDGTVTPPDSVRTPRVSDCVAASLDGRPEATADGCPYWRIVSHWGCGLESWFLGSHVPMCILSPFCMCP